MLKSILIGAAGVVFLSSILLLFWQPPSLQQRLLQEASKKTAERTPFEFTVGHMTGNLITGFTFTDVRLFRKTDHSELFHTRSLTVRLDLWTFFRRKIVQIDHLALELGGGEAEMQAMWGPDAFYRLHGSWNRASLHATFTLFGKNQAVNGTVDLQGEDRTSSSLRWVNGKARLKEGTGIFLLTLGMKGGVVNVNGTLHVPERSLQAKGEADHVLWDEKRIEKLTFHTNMNTGGVRGQIALQNLQWQAAAPKPSDILSAEMSFHGQSPRWQSAASVKFRNGSTIEAAAQGVHAKDTWVLTWDRLSASFPGGGTWTATPGGSLSWHPDGRVDLRHLLLANGSQTVEIRRALIEKESGQTDIEMRQLDPAPWLSLAAANVSMEGTINASIHTQGRFTHPDINGYVTGKFKQLSAPSIGLALKDVDIDLRSSEQLLEVHRFSGKTKKGSVQITGKSRLPNLDFSLEAHELALATDAHSKGLGDAALHLSGTLTSPILDGHIAVKEAVYALPEKRNNKKEPMEKKDTLWRRAAMDIKAEWKRNVWYRDGVSSIETSADLRIQKPRDAADVRLMGTIRSVRGSYSYFGRDFNIESGEIQFTGVPEINPLLNIEASYRRDPTIVYLDVTGTADKPELKLRSNPPLSNQDIVSVIVFGSPLNELRSRTGGPSTNEAAMQAAGGVLGSYLSKGLRQTGMPELDFDVLNIQQTQEGSQLTIGRYLTRKLFVTYGQAIRGSAEKSITANYFLTDKWTLQGTSDSLEGNYMDFLFRYPLNKRGAPTNASPLPASPFRNTLDLPAINQGAGADLR